MKKHPLLDEEQKIETKKCEFRQEQIKIKVMNNFYFPLLEKWCGTTIVEVSQLNSVDFFWNCNVRYIFSLDTFLA